MIDIIVGVIAGLLAGWWFIPQPEWAKALYELIVSKIRPAKP
jgi:hypothetical protein